MRGVVVPVVLAFSLLLPLLLAMCFQNVDAACKEAEKLKGSGRRKEFSDLRFHSVSFSVPPGKEGVPCPAFA